jgi:hypothetical protein
MAMPNNVIKTSFATVTRIKSNFLRVEINANAHVDTEMLDEARLVYEKMVDSFPVYFLTIVNDGATVSIDARNYWSTPERCNLKIAEAFVIKNLAHRLIANFVYKVQKPKHKTKFFNSEKEALNWLLKQMK